MLSIGLSSYMMTSLLNTSSVSHFCLHCLLLSMKSENSGSKLVTLSCLSTANLVTLNITILITAKLIGVFRN